MSLAVLFIVIEVLHEMLASFYPELHHCSDNTNNGFMDLPARDMKNITEKVSEGNEKLPTPKKK